MQRQRKAKAGAIRRRLCEGGRPLSLQDYGWQASFETMHYVYLLQSEADPRERYVGSTENLRLRLQQHNAGESLHTAKFKPWKLHAYFAFDGKHLAAEFEQYLKSGSGREFARRHFWLEPRPFS